MNFVVSSTVGSQVPLNADPTQSNLADPTQNNLTDPTHKRLTDQRILVDLANASERAELALVYQPQVDLSLGQIVGVDALLRWHHDQYGEIPPSRFIPIAETANLIQPLGIWVLQQACQEFVSWDKAFSRPLQLTVNVSPWQMQEADFSTIVQHVLATSQLPPAQLILELACPITARPPTVAPPQIAMSQIMATMWQLRQQGIKLALGSCGWGHATLTLLSQLPLDRLKLDRNFIQQIHLNPEAEANFYTIMNLAKRLQIPVMASGIESVDQIDFLSWHGCRLFQGYWYSPPFSAIELQQRWGQKLIPIA